MIKLRKNQLRTNDKSKRKATEGVLRYSEKMSLRGSPISFNLSLNFIESQESIYEQCMHPEISPSKIRLSCE